MASNESNNNFDAQAFNTGFEKQKEANKELSAQYMEDKLNELNNNEKPKKLYELSMSEILINIKDSWFELLDDLLGNTFGIQTLTKDYRLFYLGITIFFFACILYIYNMLTDDSSENNVAINNENEPALRNVYHIYNYDPNMRILPENN